MVDHNAEIASHFLADCEDYLLRAELAWDKFELIKSRRLKLFVDLRLAYECALKAVLAESLKLEDGVALLTKIESYRHCITKLEGDAFPLLPGGLSKLGRDLDELPVALRYRVDVIAANQELYYRTIGGDSWLDGLNQHARQVRDHLDPILAGYSKVLSGDALWDAFIEARPSKYSPPQQRS